MFFILWMAGFIIICTILLVRAKLRGDQPPRGMKVLLYLGVILFVLGLISYL
jgi:hypothetical protein